MRKYYLHHLAAGHSDKRYKLWMTPSILSSQVCKSPKASNCTFLPSVRTACKPFQSCFTTKLLFCFEYPKPDHSLTTAWKSLHLIALKGRGSSDKVPNRHLSTLFKECFLMWRGLFLAAKWRQWGASSAFLASISLMPTRASAVTHASEGKHQGDNSSQGATVGMRHSWDSDSYNIERNGESNTKIKSGLSLWKLYRAKDLF